MKKNKLPEELPNALKNLKSIFELLGTKKPSLFLDYDGTLTPIVSNPEKADLSGKNKEIIKKLSKSIPVTILSGRDRKDLKSKVEIGSIIYAGSHGFDITGPHFEMEHESEKDITPALDEAEKNLNKMLQSITGVKVERKKYAIAVHYRNVEDQNVSCVKEIVAEELKRQELLKKGSGKKIVELKPNIDWNKGRALNWLIKNMEWDMDQYLRMFIGDDITDEDAFEAIREEGIGIMVGAHGEKTAASFHLRDTSEVTDFLEQLRIRLG